MKVNFIASILASIVCANTDQLKLHPVRQEIVDEIKLKTSSWQPREVHLNHLRHVPVDKLHTLMGSLGVDQMPVALKIGSEVFKFTGDQLHKITDLIGHKNKHQLKGWADWDVVYDDETDEDSTIQTPENRDQVVIDDGEGRDTGEEYYEEDEQTDSDKPSWNPHHKPSPPPFDPHGNFNWLKEMPQCVGKIEDQQDCGACWAFTASGHLADRFCIHSKGLITTRFSPQEMINCNFENFQCLGGYLMTSIDYLQIDGAVSSECTPYMGAIENCSYKCKTPSQKLSRYYCEIGSLKVMTKQDEIKAEIKKNGPVMVSLMIYEDFLNYDKGIYKHTAGKLVGGHAMKMIGYGQDETEGLYWVLQNQWTDDWGDKGFIKIKAGEIGIDSVALSCMPDLNEAKRQGLLF